VDNCVIVNVMYKFFSFILGGIIFSIIYLMLLLALFVFKEKDYNFLLGTIKRFMNRSKIKN